MRLEGYATLLEAARRDGVDAAYRSLLLTLLAAEFVAASPARQRALLAEQGTDPASNSVAAILEQAQHLEPSQIPTWISELARIARQHPAVLVSPHLGAHLDPDHPAARTAHRRSRGRG